MGKLKYSEGMGAEKAAEPKTLRKQQEPCPDEGQQQLLELFGTIDYDETYDYKSERNEGSRLK